MKRYAPTPALILSVALLAIPASATTTKKHPPSSTIKATYPVGVPAPTLPSGMSPPLPSALAGYTQSYVTNFLALVIPANWDTYSGQPGGDPGAMFAPTHVGVANGLLTISTYQDPAFANQWVTGGICLCGIPGQVYGAYFVRSRLTGPGPTGVELLWPDGNSWPPEIDFNETYGPTNATSATVHYTSANSQIHDSLKIPMTRWHTWGVIWTPTSITYTVDGKVWARVAQVSAIPTVPMHLSLQSQTWCESSWACPTKPQAMQVAWVAQYTPTSP